MAVELTEGAITMITKGEMQAADVKPVLQVIGGRHGISSNGLYPLVLTDGSFSQQAVFITERDSKLLKYGCIVRLKEYGRLTIAHSYWIRITDLEVIREDCGIINPDSTFCPIRPPIPRSLVPKQSIIHPTTTTDKMPLKETRVEGNKRLIEEPDVCMVCKKRKLMENESDNPDINHTGKWDRVYLRLKKNLSSLFWFVVDFYE